MCCVWRLKNVSQRRRSLYFADPPPPELFPLRLIQDVFAHGQVFVGDAVGLEENPSRARLRSAVGDDAFQRHDAVPAQDTEFADREGDRVRGLSDALTAV